MSITSVASSFSWVPPVMAVAQTAQTARVVETAASSASGDQDERQNDSNRSFPAQLASEKVREDASKPTSGILVRVQAENSQESESVSARTAAAAYAGR